MNTVFIIFAIITIISLIPIKIQLLINDKKKDLNVYILKAIRMNLNIIIENTYKTKSNDLLSPIIRNIEITKNNSILIKELLLFINIDVIKVSYGTKSLLSTFLYLNSIYILRNFIQSNTLNVSRENFTIYFSETDNLSIELAFNFRCIYILIAYVISVYKKIKEKREHNIGAPNK